MGDAAKGIAEVEPGEVYIFLVPSAVCNDGLEGEGVLVTAFVWASTFLVGG